MTMIKHTDNIKKLNNLTDKKTLDSRLCFEF